MVNKLTQKMWTLVDRAWSKDDKDDWIWRENAPDEILILVRNKQAVMLAWCGRSNEWEEEQGLLHDYFDQSDRWELEDGLWIVPGRVRFSRHETMDGVEHDAEWVADGKPRRLTDEEWEWYLEDVEQPCVWSTELRESRKDD